MDKKLLIKMGIIILGIGVLLLLAMLIWYSTSIKPVDKKSEEEIKITIPMRNRDKLYC